MYAGILEVGRDAFALSGVRALGRAVSSAARRAAWSLPRVLGRLAHRRPCARKLFSERVPNKQLCLVVSFIRMVTKPIGRDVLDLPDSYLVRETERRTAEGINHTCNITNSSRCR